ncbi:unnamed protein product, partial [Prorocentrum cordatum]
RPGRPRARGPRRGPVQRRPPRPPPWADLPQQQALQRGAAHRAHDGRVGDPESGVVHPAPPP